MPEPQLQFIGAARVRAACDRAVVFVEFASHNVWCASNVDDDK